MYIIDQINYYSLSFIFNLIILLLIIKNRKFDSHFTQLISTKKQNLIHRGR
jgi:hypothetical protein